ncbi:MAG TPA: Na/Pi cotransporter family protein [Sedimentisphaerales bacterium]|nr:Na/Pi cotransporter family protein [Sedimentisphaerales bacterium]
MIKDMIFGTVGGLGLFLFGMGLMSDGLKKVAGQKLKGLLESLTKHRVIAVIVGALTTCLIQSSSATTVMTVGFVNAGLLTLKQALCVVLGANVGTTITAGLVSVLAVFKITNYALPVVGVGFLINVLGKTERTRSIGQVMIGFGVLFLGIHFMKEAFDPLKDSQGVQEALIWLGRNPLLAVLTGTVITMLLQSSSASIAIIQMLAFQGAFGTDWPLVLQVTIPYILGDNIGTTITAQLAALRSSRNAKRTAMGHTIFNVIGVMYMLPLVWMGWYSYAVEWLTPGKLGQNTIMTNIFFAHFMFNAFNTIVFLPFIQGLAALVVKIIPVTEIELAQKPVVLEKHLLDTPVIALEQTKREIIRMAQTAKKAVMRSISGIISNNRKELGSVRDLEDFIDILQLEITSYLSALSRRNLSDEVSIELPVLLHTVNDLERIGDHAVNIVEIGERKIGQKLLFSDSALDEADVLRKEIEQMCDNIITALKDNNIKEAKSALVHENNLNRMQIEFRRSHVERMAGGVCSPQTGLIFIDLVDNIEKIGDHLTNIAQAIIGGLQWEGVKPKISPDS